MDGSHVLKDHLTAEVEYPGIGLGLAEIHADDIPRQGVDPDGDGLPAAAGVAVTRLQNKAVFNELFDDP